MMNRLYRSKWLLKRTIICINYGTALRLMPARRGAEAQAAWLDIRGAVTQPDPIRFTHPIPTVLFSSL